MTGFRIVSLTSLLVCVGCSAITSPGSFQFDAAATGCPEADAVDLAIEVRNFEEFEDQQIQIMAVDGTNDLVFRAILDHIDHDGVSDDGTDNSARLCLVIPELVDAHDSLVIRTFVDREVNGFYQPVDGTGADFEEGWQDDVTDGVVVIDGTDDPTGFDDPSSASGNFQVSTTGMNVHVPNTQHLAAMVIDPADGVPIGFYRLADVNTSDPVIFLNEILEPDSTYDLEFYVDFVTNGYYDPPPMGDHSWFREYTSDAVGDISEDFAHNTEFDVLDYF